MRMRMHQARVLMAMGMRFARRIVGQMRVLMTLVVVMEMFVFYRLVDVLACVLLVTRSQTLISSARTPAAQKAQSSWPWPIAKASAGPCKRRGGKVGAGASRSEVTECVNEENKTYPVTEKTNSRHTQNNTHSGQLRAC